MERAALSAKAVEQYGVFSFAQAIEAGVSASSLTRLTRTGEYERLHHGIYRLKSSEDGWRQRLMSACLARAPDAVASHLSAARVWHWRVGPVRIREHEMGPLPEITLTDRKRGDQLAGVTVHRSRRFLPDDRTIRDFIPVTTPVRTVVDLCETLDDRNLEIMVEAALHSGKLSENQLRQRVENRRGDPKALRRLKAWLDVRGGNGSDSALEVRVWSAIIRHGLARPVKQCPVVTDRGTVHLDLAYPDLKIGIECHGGEEHRRADQWLYDYARSTRLAADNWLMLTPTWHAFDQDEAGVIESIRKAREVRLAAARSRLLLSKAVAANAELTSVGERRPHLLVGT